MFEKIRERFFSPAGLALWELLDKHPEQFEQSRYTLKHLKTGIEFWTANSFLYFDFYQVDDKARLGCIERFFLYRKTKSLIRRRINHNNQVLAIRLSEWA